MAVLTGIYIKNFQSIKDPFFLKLNKLCLLYGPNSAGKSSILDALDLIKRTVNSENEKYSLEYFYKKNQNRINDSGLSVGVEVEIQNRHEYRFNKEFEEWWESPDQRGEYFHQNFFEKIYGKKWFIEFSQQGQGIKISIDDKPIFEFEFVCTDYDDFYKKTNELSDSIDGRLTIYKNNSFNDYFDHEYREFLVDSRNTYLPMSDYFLDLFIEENDKKLVINGLIFDSEKRLSATYVSVDSGVNDVIFARYKTLKSYKSLDIDYQKFIDDQFKESTKKGKKETQKRYQIYWNMENVARDFDKLIKGFFIHLKFCLEYHHVRSDRQILDSDCCFSYPENLNLEPKNCKLSLNDPMSEYARKLAYDLKPRLFGTKRIDFIQKALTKYLTSLKGYKIYPVPFTIRQVGDSEVSEDSNVDNEFIFLKIQYKKINNLGFQDVGSGISFVFPILTSLWSSNLSFIEQPELHLHPSAQCELGDVFIAAYNKGSLAIVESHSEHMLLRILRRIRETNKNQLLPKELKFSSNDLIIYYFNPGAGGFTSVKEIRVDDCGELMNTWPGGFFSERDRELFGE